METAELAELACYWSIDGFAFVLRDVIVKRGDSVAILAVADSMGGAEAAE